MSMFVLGCEVRGFLMGLVTLAAVSGYANGIVEGQAQNSQMVIQEMLGSDGSFAAMMIENGTKNKQQNLEESYVFPNLVTVVVEAVDDFRNVVVATVVNEDGQEIDRQEYQVEKNEGTGEWRVRFFNGEYLDADFQDVIVGQLGEDHFGGTGITGVEIGKVIYKNFKGWPLNIMWMLGVTRHFEQGYQDDFNSLTGMVRLEWTEFPWNRFVRTRIDLSVGSTYSSKVPYFEGLDVRESNNGDDSRLLHHLGASYGLNTRDLVNLAGKPFAKEIVNPKSPLERCYVGGYVWHRSGVYGTVGLYNNISGGANWTTFYLDCAF